jgi:hypothetical protein
MNDSASRPYRGPNGIARFVIWYVIAMVIMIILFLLLGSSQ